ncbi:hypothetical protein [Mycobacteroides salmoniphilum]|uniref:Uncharacterized protein n=1 Tax=Mycobacteroides salmoniphilum TaxID=404941 RepID=A0A4R8SJ23_9MYCO|nr:hypothetical protein [Mycobacteroides salmoniphilum]TDZ97170.1 hypothetical protein CCUG60885_00710 [Mycobacteroides salmoniphilum]TEA01401.1 hypothetical protein CCUG60883_03931 [Mycobacteroides salmoniphilum]
MASRMIAGGALAILCGAGIFLAPNASADPVPPGPPPGYDGLPYHNMPGRIGHQPGAYTWILGFWMRPRRVLDTAGVAAMTNTDAQSAEFGLPGSQLGVEPQRRSMVGNAFGVRPESQMEATGAPDPAGGVTPGYTMPVGSPGGGLEDPYAGTARQLPLGGESLQPSANGTVGPSSVNSGPDTGPTLSK